MAQNFNSHQAQSEDLLGLNSSNGYNNIQVARNGTYPNAFDADEMNASEDSLGKDEPMPMQFGQVDLNSNRVKSNIMDQKVGQFEFQSHVDDDLMAQIAAASQNLMQNQQFMTNNNQQAHPFNDFNFDQPEAPIQQNAIVKKEQDRPQKEQDEQAQILCFQICSIMFVMEMFPLVDRVIIEDLFDQLSKYTLFLRNADHNRDDVVEAILQLEQGSNLQVNPIQQKRSQEEQKEFESQMDKDAQYAMKIQQQEIALQRQHQFTFNEGQQQNRQQRLSQAVREQQLVQQQTDQSQPEQQLAKPQKQNKQISSVLEGGRDAPQAMPEVEPVQKQKKTNPISQFFKSCMSSKPKEPISAAKRPQANPSSKKKQHSQNQLGEEDE